MKKLYSASNKLTAIGMGEKKPSGQKTDAEVSKSGSTEDTKVKNFHHSLSHYGLGDFLHQNFQWQTPSSSSLHASPNTQTHTSIWIKWKGKYFLTKKFHLRMKMLLFSLVTCRYTLLQWSKLPSCTTPPRTEPCCSVVAMHRRTYSGTELLWEMMVWPQRNISELKILSFWESLKFSIARSGKLIWKL